MILAWTLALVNKPMPLLRRNSCGVHRSWIWRIYHRLVHDACDTVQAALSNPWSNSPKVDGSVIEGGCA